MKFNSEHILKSQKGSTYPVIIAAVLAVIIAAASLTDVIYCYYQHYTLISMTRQAAVKGAEALLKSKYAAEQAIKLNLMRNVKDLTKLNTVISDNCREITVSVKKPFEYYFIRYFGADKSELTSKVTVRLTGVMAITNVRPFGVLQKNLNFDKSYTLTNSEITNSADTLKIIPLKLGDDKFINAVILGCTGKTKVDDTVKAYPGITKELSASVSEKINTLIKNCDHKPACTFEKYNDNCSRIIIIPVVSGASKEGQYKISGFTAFFIEKSNSEGDCFYITGRFIKHTVKADMSDGVQNYGLEAIRVIDD